jgi:hypothetical protein
MHQSSEKDFKIARRWQMHRGLPCVIGELPAGGSSGGGSSSFFNLYFFFVFYIEPYIIMNAHVMLMKMQR